MHTKNDMSHELIVTSPKLGVEALVTQKPLQFPCQQADIEHTKASHQSMTL